MNHVATITDRHTANSPLEAFLMIPLKRQINKKINLNATSGQFIVSAPRALSVHITPVPTVTMAANVHK